MSLYSLKSKARKTLDGMKPQVFESLELTASTRNDRVFDLAASIAVWALVDGGHTEKTVLPYLTHLMKTHLDKGAFK